MYTVVHEVNRRQTLNQLDNRYSNPSLTTILLYITCSFLSPEKLQEIAEPHYVPSDEDIANCKERPGSIVESTPIINHVSFTYVLLHEVHASEILASILTVTSKVAYN